MMERRLIKLMLSRDFFQTNRKLLVREMFPDYLATIYDTICDAHEKYEQDLTMDELKALHRTNYPTMTRAQRKQVEELFIDIELDEETITEDVARDVLHHMWKAETGRRIAQIGLDIADGRRDDLNELVRLIEQTRADFMPADETKPVTTDLDELLDEISEPKWNLNIPSLHDRVPGVDPGTFVVNFARPEVGKTASWVSLCAAPGGFCHQGAKVLALCNEEPAKRTMIRCISACTGMSKSDLVSAKDRTRARDLFTPIRGLLDVRDAHGLTIGAMDALVATLKPDIVVVDQLDKLSIQGDFSRDDQRLRMIYLETRNIAVRHGCVVFGISQASYEADGKTVITYSMMEGSKTGKGAEADLILGFGKPSTVDGMDDTNSRYICVSKNKISGWHGTIPVLIEPEVSRYIA